MTPKAVFALDGSPYLSCHCVEMRGFLTNFPFYDNIGACFLAGILA
jgi:hypothetical protein